MGAAWRKLVASTVVVNCKSGDVFTGVIWEAPRGFVVLRNAAALAGGEETGMDGECIIPTTEITFIQRES